MNLFRKPIPIANRITLPLVFLLLLDVVTWSQKIECGSDIIHKHKLGSDVEYRRQQQDLRAAIQAFNSDNDHGTLTDTVITVPVVVHVIHLGEPLGTGSNISDIQIQEAIDGLNDRFRNTSGTGVDTKMEFCLAKEDPNGNTSNGIARIDGTILPDYQTDGINWWEDWTVKSLSVWPATLYYNIWLTWSVNGGTSGGYSSYPTNGYQYDGTVLDVDRMKYSKTTLTHETGHWFNLHHTFDNTTTCSAESNCATQGDECCDTPPHNSGDCSTSENYCNAPNFDNSRKNYMSYCGSTIHFTQDQKDRMRSAALTTSRLTVVTSPAAACNDILAGMDNTNTSMTLIKVYPNPIKDITVLELQARNTGVAKILLHDAIGREIKIITREVRKGNNRLEIKLSFLPKGVYSLGVVLDNSQFQSLKLIK